MQKIQIQRINETSVIYNSQVVEASSREWRGRWQNITPPSQISGRSSQPISLNLLPPRVWYPFQNKLPCTTVDYELYEALNSFAMCFYDQYRFSCGDIEWACFRHSCSKSTSPGTPCGKKTEMQPIISRPTLCANCVKFKVARKHLSTLRARVRRYRIERPENWHLDILDDLRQIADLWKYIAELRERATTFPVMETFDTVLTIDHLMGVYDKIDAEKAQLEEAAEFILLNE